MTPLDWIFIVAYFGVLLRVGLVDHSEGEGPRMTTSWPAGISAGSWSAASIFASNIGSEHLVGLAGAGATRGRLL